IRNSFPFFLQLKAYNLRIPVHYCTNSSFVFEENHSYLNYFPDPRDLLFW
ncbi:9566_t:CDS:1, partial [Dentiscutata erythropus]